MLTHLRWMGGLRLLLPSSILKCRGGLARRVPGPPGLRLRRLWPCCSALAPSPVPPAPPEHEGAAWPPEPPPPGPRWSVRPRIMEPAGGGEPPSGPRTGRPGGGGARFCTRLHIPMKKAVRLRIRKKSRLANSSSTAMPATGPSSSRNSTHAYSKSPGPSFPRVYKASSTLLTCGASRALVTQGGGVMPPPPGPMAARAAAEGRPPVPMPPGRRPNGPAAPLEGEVPPLPKP